MSQWLSDRLDWAKDPGFEEAVKRRMEAFDWGRIGKGKYAHAVSLNSSLWSICGRGPIDYVWSLQTTPPGLCDVCLYRIEHAVHLDLVEARELARRQSNWITPSGPLDTDPMP